MAENKNAFTMEDLKAKINNYRNFATKEIAPENVFTSAVFHKDAIAQILANAPDADGVRIYSIKNSDTDTSDDMSYMMVPVKQENGGFLDQIHDAHVLMTDSFMFAKAEPCMGPLCK